MPKGLPPFIPWMSTTWTFDLTNASKKTTFSGATAAFPNRAIDSASKPALFQSNLLDAMPRPNRKGAQPRRSKPRKRRKVYILAYEGNYAEPQYYNELKSQWLHDREEHIELVSLHRPADNTNSAPKHVFKQLKRYKTEYLTDPDDEFWMIIDRDKWRLDEWVEKCHAEQNFHIALSNPCFELWLLMHVFKLDDFSAAELFENRRLGRKRRFLDNYLGQHLPEGYKKNNILPERFVTEEGIRAAIEQARQLDQGDIMEVLGSYNYKLLEKLLKD